MAPRPIMTASAAPCSNIARTFSGVVASPFPIRGMSRRAALILGNHAQRASPRYIWARVRAWTARAATPVASSIRATSSIRIDSSFQPSRVLTVTGRVASSRTAPVMASILSRLRRMPAPPSLQTTFLTGHPKLMSISVGSWASAIRAASRTWSISPPKIWMPTGRSSS